MIPHPHQPKAPSVMLLLLVVLMAIVPTSQGFVVPSISGSSYVRRAITLHASTAANKDASFSNGASDGTAPSYGSTSDQFHFPATEIDDVNTPPSFHKLSASLKSLKSGSDIRGQFVDHQRTGSLTSVIHSIIDRSSSMPPLTPLAAYCFGASFANMVKQECADKVNDDKLIKICVGLDPRPHGVRLADAFARGVEGVEGVQAVYNGLSTTPSMFEFCRADLCDGGAMITASHLPEDRNGIKLFTKSGGYTKADIDTLIIGAIREARHWHDFGVLPPTSGDGAVDCTHVDFMPHYRNRLRDAIIAEVGGGDKPLAGLKIVLNAGNGSGYFFNDILADLGADVSNSFLLTPDGTFPSGVPNPESTSMIAETKSKCEECCADLGILFDTDADRSGFILPRTVAKGSLSAYEPLNRNRLIALLSVIFSSSSPGCTIVTDSVTSEGLAKFLTADLGLEHVRYLKGYANVIGKAVEITESGHGNAEMAIETSGHCAMKENGYLDDGTYTAVKIVGLLARTYKTASGGSLLDLISGLQEKAEENELRMNVLDGSLESTQDLFDQFARMIEAHTEGQNKVEGWELDTENLEGVRVRTGGGGFFMLRKSLHDPLISLQIEGDSTDEVRSAVISPILDMIRGDNDITNGLDIGVLREY